MPMFCVFWKPPHIPALANACVSRGALWELLEHSGEAGGGPEAPELPSLAIRSEGFISSERWPIPVLLPS